MMNQDLRVQNRIKNVREILLDFSDAQYQHRAWFTSASEWDSPGEMYHALFGSHGFEDFIESSEINLTETQKSICRTLRDALRDFQAEMGQDPDPISTYKHPKWMEIRSLAADALAAMTQERSSAKE